MPFASGLRESLQFRDRQVHSELTGGDSLEHVLNRHLAAVEGMAEGDILTSVLLLSSDGKRLAHAAAPNLPPSYCNAIDGSEIGPRAGSCGTAAFLGRPVYVTDIASDPLWADYRQLALPHGLLACWSTPIPGQDGSIVGTFAIYHRRTGSPTPDEIDAITMITKHVAEAIRLARGVQDLEKVPSGRGRSTPQLKLVSRSEGDSVAAAHWSVRFLANVEKLRSMADQLGRCADDSDSPEAAEGLRAAAENCLELVESILGEIRVHNERTTSRN